MHVILMIVSILAGGAHLHEAWPPPTELVTDRAGVLSASDREILTQKLAHLADVKLAVALVYVAESLPADGEEMEEFTLRTVNEWRVGRAGVDDGLVIFVFMKQRRLRIELGYGLEPAISNDAAKRVIDEQIVPAFRQGNYGAGLIAAVDELTRLLQVAKP